MLQIGSAKMTVLEEILEWSLQRPAWQRAALRRLALKNDLTDGDIHAVLNSVRLPTV